MAMVVQMACLSPRKAYQLVLIPCKATVAGKRKNGAHDDEKNYGHTKNISNHGLFTDTVCIIDTKNRAADISFFSQAV